MTLDVSINDKYQMTNDPSYPVIPRKEVTIMKILRKFSAFYVGLILLASTALAQSRRPMTFDDLIAMKRVGDAQISPDGRQVAYVVNAIDKNLNRGKRSIWVVAATGGDPRALISSDKNDDTPRWSSDGRQIAFLSTRDGAPQIYVAGADGASPRKVTNAPGGVSEFIWSPDGKSFAF